jgi:hypothetical protein
MPTDALSDLSSAIAGLEILKPVWRAGLSSGSSVIRSETDTADGTVFAQLHYGCGEDSPWSAAVSISIRRTAGNSAQGAYAEARHVMIFAASYQQKKEAEGYAAVRQYVDSNEAMKQLVRDIQQRESEDVDLRSRFLSSRPRP